MDLNKAENFINYKGPEAQGNVGYLMNQTCKHHQGHYSSSSTTNIGF